MKRYLYALRYLISIHVLGLILFTAFRLILFLQGYEYLMDEEISVFTRLEAFVRGLWLDNVVACYISILPLVIVSICSLIGYFGKNLYRGIHIFFSVFYVVAFAISAADIPYFAYFFKHINASIFNWFGYTGTTLGLMFGEFSYIVAFVLFLCLSFLFVFLSRILLHRTCRDIQRVSAEKFHWKPELLTLLCSTLLIGVCLFGIRGRMGYNPIKVSAAYYCNNTFLNQLGISPSFNLLRSSLEVSKSENREIDLMDEKEAISTVRRELNITDSLPDISPIARKIENPGQPSRKNVVLVFMESMSAELLGHFGNPEHLTPFLDSIAVRSLCFNRFFSAGTHTNHAIHSVLYSYPALMKRNSMKGAVIPFFVGDHGKIVGTPRSDMPLSFNHVPLFIYSPSFIEPRQIEDLGGQVDIAPTVLGLLNIDYTDNGFGVNLLQEKRKAAFFTSDDAIGCVNDSLFYIYKPKENQEWLLSQERAIEKGGNIDNPAVCQELREYAFSMLQTAQYLMSNNLTGKYIGYQPR